MTLVDNRQCDALCGVFSYRISVLILWQLFVIGRHSPSMIWSLCPFSRNVLVLRVVGLVALDVALSTMCEGVVRVAELVFPAPLVYIVLVFRICNSVLILAPLLFLAVSLDGWYRIVGRVWLLVRPVRAFYIFDARHGEIVSC